MTDRESVLFANDAFYAAFASGDVAAMQDIWAEDVPVSCIHPGWAALTTRSAVLKSWARILRSPPAIGCHAPEVFVYSDTATVICFEQISESFLLATNIFVRRGTRWRMVHHHAGMTNAAPAEPERSTRDTIN